MKYVFSRWLIRFRKKKAVQVSIIHYGFVGSVVINYVKLDFLMFDLFFLSDMNFQSRYRLKYLLLKICLLNVAVMLGYLIIYFDMWLSSKKDVSFGCLVWMIWNSLSNFFSTLFIGWCSSSNRSLWYRNKYAWAFW